MKRSELIFKFPDSVKDYEESENINPLDVFEASCFKRNRPSAHGYREQAVEKCLKNKVDFCSTSNSIFILAKMFIEVECPNCHSKIKALSGGETPSSLTVDFLCDDCRTLVKITVPTDGIYVKFPKE